MNSNWCGGAETHGEYVLGIASPKKKNIWSGMGCTQPRDYN
jgi:hypothetical protein